MILELALSLNLSWAQTDKEVSFKDKAHITTLSLQVDHQNAEIPLNCKAFSNPTSSGVKARLKSAAGISYALECKGQEIGESIDLLVLKNGLQISKFDSVATVAADCGYRSEAQSWLQDMNGDKMMDVVTRFKSKNVESDCGKGRKAPKAEDSLTVYFWNADKLTHEKANLDNKDIKKLLKKYDFDLK